jgi:hypothetical protein
MSGSLVIHLRAVFIRPMIQFGLTLGACAACLGFRPSIESQRFRWWAAILVSVVVVDLFVADWRLNPTTDAALYHTPTASARITSDGRVLWLTADADDIKFRRYFSFQGFGPEDVTHWLGVRESLLPNVAMIERVLSANNFDSLVQSRYNDVMTLMERFPLVDALRLAGAMNARYIVSPREWPLPVVHRNEDVAIYRNDTAVDRAWIVPQARVVRDPLAMLADRSFDPRRIVLLDSADAPVLEFAAGPSSVTLRDSPNTVTIRATSEFGGFLVLADTFYPGWQATLDGQPIRILRANYAFRAVALPPGEHTVVFQYAPLSFRVGVAISLVALAIVVGWLIFLSWRRTWQVGYSWRNIGAG